MGKGRIEISRFVGYLPTGFIVLAILYLPHDVYAVGNHDENDTHVLSESQQQVAEILGLDGRAFGIKFVYTYQSPDDACHILAIDLLHFQSGASAAAHGVVQHEPPDRSTLHSDFFRYNDSRLHIFDDGIQTEYITLDTVVLYSIDKMCFQLFAVPLLEGFSGKLQQFAVEREE